MHAHTHAHTLGTHMHAPTHLHIAMQMCVHTQHTTHATHTHIHGHARTHTHTDTSAAIHVWHACMHRQTYMCTHTRHHTLSLLISRTMKGKWAFSCTCDRKVMGGNLTNILPCQSAFSVEISSRAPLDQGSLYSGSTTWDDCGRAFSNELVWARFPGGFVHYAWKP